MLPHILRALLILTMCSSSWASIHPVACERAPATTKATDTSTTEQTARWSVTYDPAGRITGFTPSAPAVTATSTLNPQSTAYGYDGNGNRLSSNQTQPTPSVANPTANTTTSRDYQYSEGNNRLTHFTQTLANAQGQTSTQNTYTLDTQGQLLSDGLRNYGYDAQGRLSDITTTTNTGTTTTRYAHNALGQRIFKTEPQYSTAKAAGVEEGTDTNQDLGLIDTLVNFFTQLWNPIARPAEKQGFAYLYDEEGTLLAEYGSGGVASAGNAKYIYLPTATGPQPVLTIQSDKPYAVHADHLNTPRRLTQADGQVAWQWAYSAFGDEAPTTAANRFTSPSTNPTTGTTAMKQVVFNLRYPGQYADAESNLFYNYFRSYDPKTGRYPQPDPIGLNGGFNRFLYANGNPLSYKDSRGLWGEHAHEVILRAAFGNVLPAYLVQHILDGSASVDAPVNQIPFVGNSYEHAMRDPSQSVAEARASMCKFIQSNMTAYRRFLKQGNLLMAYRYLGKALHPIMDSTSPVHRGFQAWHPIDEGVYHGNAHGSLEGVDSLTPELLKETVDLINDAVSGKATCPCGSY
jgi:RHS repeat-associated protein